MTTTATATATMSTPGTEGALAGLRVLEVGALIAGPFAGRLLGDNGADVIKIEAPGAADPLRGWGQVHQDERGLFWTIHARNKRCVTLDLRKPEGQSIFHQLADQSDVVIESFRPGTLERWGLGFDHLTSTNPRLVLARVSGYGQTGPLARRPGYASVAEAMSGMRYLTGMPGEPPVRTALSIGDSLAGMFAVQGILAALLARVASGRGQIVDVALSDSCLALTESMVPDYDRAGLIRQPSGTRLDGIAPSNIYPTADSTWLVVAANQDSVFRRLCAAMGQSDLADDPRFATHLDRARNQDLLDKLIGLWTATKSRADLLECLDAADVAVGPINTVAEVVHDPQYAAREMLLQHFDDGLEMTVLGPGVTPKLSRTPGSVRWAGPAAPGKHNEEVYRELLGLGAEELFELQRRGVV